MNASFTLSFARLAASLSPSLMPLLDLRIDRYPKESKRPRDKSAEVKRGEGRVVGI